MDLGGKTIRGGLFNQHLGNIHAVQFMLLPQRFENGPVGTAGVQNFFALFYVAKELPDFFNARTAHFDGGVPAVPLYIHWISDGLSGTWVFEKTGWE